jgi:hypothetical protein
MASCFRLGFTVAQSTVAKYMAKPDDGHSGQSWGTFLRNHLPYIAATDLFVVPTVTFAQLCVLVIVRLAQRELVWVNVTAHPTADWIAQQIPDANDPSLPSADNLLCRTTRPFTSGRKQIRARLPPRGANSVNSPARLSTLSNKKGCDMRNHGIGLIAVIVALGSCFAFDAKSADDGFFELQTRFVAVVLKGDAAAVKAMSVAAEAEKIWTTLQSKQIDKAKSIWVRHIGVTENKGVYDLTAQMSDGKGIPLRVDVIGASENPLSGWKLQAVKFDP